MPFQMQNRYASVKDGSLCFWSWNDELQEEEIKRQMEEFADGRFSGVIIHSRSGLRIPYMGEEWFRCYRYSLSQAERLGLEVWIYDEDGWPSGFAGGKVPSLGESYQVKSLKFSSCKPGDPETRIAAWRKKGNEFVIIDKDLAEPGDLVCWFVRDKNYVDLLSSDTVKQFIKYTHEKYKEEVGEYFGKTIKGIFTDEPQFMKFPWSKALTDAWTERYGMDITNNLYMLVEESGDWKTFRNNFYSIVSDLFHKAFTCQIENWCEKNGLLFTGHFAMEDGLVDQMNSNAGVMRHYASMSMPGIDHLGNRITSPVLCKQISSIASQFGQKEVLSETYGCAGWQMSFDRLCWLWGRQSVLGVTKPCFHLSAYSIAGRRKRDYPAFFSYQEPWWKQFPDLTRWINGLNNLMKEGKREVDTLVISPLSGVACYFGTTKAEYYSCEYRKLIESLLDIQLDCELGDETVISESGRIEDGCFCIGNSKYKYVMIPPTHHLNKTTVDLLNKFVKSGGKMLYIGQKPDNYICECANYPESVIVQNRRDMIEKAVIKFSLERGVLLMNTEQDSIKHGAVIQTRLIPDGKRIHIWTNSDFCKGDTDICIKSENPNYGIYLIDVESGRKERLDSFYDGEYIVSKIDILPCSNTVLQLSPSEEQLVSNFTEIETKTITGVNVNLTDVNALTLDYAAVSIGNDDYSEYQPIIQMLQQLYELRENYDADQQMPVRIKYHFDCTSNLELSSITAVIEDEFVKAIYVNDKLLETKRTGWWIDRKFGEYVIGPMLRSGENEVILYYELPRSLKGTKAEGFESERNRFFYPIEPDCIYIKGDFDVSCSEKPTNCRHFYKLYDSKFIIDKPSGKKAGDLTLQNMWFYRGNVKYSFDIMSAKVSHRYFLEIINPHATAAQIMVNGKSITRIFLKQSIDITGLLSEGKNKVEVLMLGSNRNLMGPHHHLKGEPSIVGPDTFSGNYGFEDFVSPDIKFGSTWTDAYSFVPFGCDGFKISDYV